MKPLLQVAIPVICATLVTAIQVAAQTAAQNIPEFTLPTPWSAEVLAAEVPLAEYPRPQMVRADWMCLNGRWDYMGGKGLPNPREASTPAVFGRTPERILVPFAPEAELSGIGRAGETNLWYRRTVDIPASWRGRRVLLHFGAVDRIAAVFVNGTKAATHTGGYTAFSVDITDMLTSGANTIVVGAHDPNDGRAPSGKNGPRGDYTFTSGIWQTVWIEPVAERHVARLTLTPDVEAGRLAIEVEAIGGGGLTVSATATDGGRKVSAAKGVAGAKFFLDVPDARLWSPDDPHLYDLTVELKDSRGRVVDAVDSYFAMRSVELGKVDGVTRTLLNGRFELQLGLLDQGYWPDGVFTAPTDEALRHDIEVAKRTGFNVIRKHIKVEPMRWYHHCDRLGVMVWQDMPNLWEPDGADSVAVRAQFRTEWREIMGQLSSVPSIVAWVPFNENWGAFDVAEIADWTKQNDPTRLVNANSGFNYAPGYRPAAGDPGNGDFIDRHNYGPIDERNTPEPEERRAASIGEFGGKGLFVRGHMWPVRNNAYEMMTSSAVLTDTYVTLLTEVEQMMLYRGVSCAIYTQTTDLEHEINGLVTYDRRVEKMDFDRVRAINRAVIESGRRFDDARPVNRAEQRVYPQ